MHFMHVYVNQILYGCELTDKTDI